MGNCFRKTTNNPRPSPPVSATRNFRPDTNLINYTLDELKSATRNFRPDTVLGEGGFGRVFKGWIDKNTFKPSRVGVGIPVAVKKSNPDSLQGLQEWQSEVQFLGKFSHPNLVKLIGYCWEENHFLLVYEYMQKGSLESHLFRSGPEPLSWDIRLKIAIGAARGLAFLHTSEESVIYRDFKSSNILLDGVCISLDTNQPAGMQNLVECTMSCLHDKKRLKEIIDPRMNEQYSLRAAFQIAQLVLKCLETDPKKRPSTKEVLGTLEKARAIKYKPKGKKVCQTSQRRSPSIHYNNGYPKSRTNSPPQ
ncbi:hypothetical protein JHK82_014110 [Glycine max]|nr:hypothetical protein JHK82_014110 [Glycine max]